MKQRHNKKRNTAFLFECLNRVFTRSILKENNQKKRDSLTILTEHFKKGSILYEELQVYNSILNTRSLSKRLAEKTLFEAKKKHASLSKKEIFDEQTVVLKKINKVLNKDSYASFTPNYKNLATVYQVFNSDLSPINRVLLEEKVLEYMASPKEDRSTKIKPIDKLTFKVFTEKFNSIYDDNLLEEQKGILNAYVSSYNGDDTELKIYVNREVGRLKESIRKSITSNSANKETNKKLNLVLETVDSFKDKKIDKNVVEIVLKVQNLVKELQ
jgi:hypothetical protein